MKEESQIQALRDATRRKRGAINQLAIGFIIVLWGGLLTLKQVGIIQKDVSTWPFVFMTFGTLLIIGSVYRLYLQEE